MASNTPYDSRARRSGNVSMSASVILRSVKPSRPKVVPRKLAKMEPVLQRLGRDIVHVKVGKELQDFGIHKSLICNASPFFKKAFTSDFQERETGIMKMAETEVEVFDLFFTWLYSPTHWYKEFRDSNPSQTTLFHLYVFADMIQIPTLKNASLRILHESVVKVEAGELLIDPNMFSYIWENTTPSSSLRRLAIDLCVWKIDFENVFADHWAPMLSPEICYEIIRAMGKKLRDKSFFRNSLPDVGNYDEPETLE